MNKFHIGNACNSVAIILACILLNPRISPADDRETRPGTVSPGWTAEYFPNENLEGMPALVRHEKVESLDYRFGPDPPAPGLPPNRFSIRWTRTAMISDPGDYLVSAGGDDGVRLVIDGGTVLDGWKNQRFTTYQKIVHLEIGPHVFILEYYNHNDSGSVAFALEKTGHDTAIPEDCWRGEYFNNTELSGSPVRVRNDGTEELKFKWKRRPSLLVNDDNYSVRWSRVLIVPGNELYTFVTDVKEGIRLFLDDKLTTDRWDLAKREDIKTATVSLAQGTHRLRVEYRHKKGTAKISFRWIHAESGAGRRRPNEYAPKKGKWYRGDLHAHSTYSDGKESVASMISAAEKDGLDFFVLTEHNNFKQWHDESYRSQRLTLLYGAEWTVNQGLSGFGHMNIWSNRPFDWNVIKPTLGNFKLKEANSSDVRSAIQLAHSMAGPDRELAVSINHPDLKWEYPFEHALEADCMEVWNGSRSDSTLNRHFHEYLSRGFNLTIAGGSDNHGLKENGRCPVVWVFAESRDALPLVRAIKAGHTFINDSVTGAQVHLFTLVDVSDPQKTRNGEKPQAQKRTLMMGDTIPSIAIGREAEFRIEVANARNTDEKKESSLLIIIKSGQVLKIERFTLERYTYTFKDTPRAGDYYRAELRHIAFKPGRELGEYISNNNIAAITNPIYTQR